MQVETLSRAVSKHHAGKAPGNCVARQVQPRAVTTKQTLYYRTGEYDLVHCSIYGVATVITAMEGVQEGKGIEKAPFLYGN